MAQWQGEQLRCDAEIIQSERMLRERVRHLQESVRRSNIQATRAERAMLEGQGYEYFHGAYRAADQLANALRGLAYHVGRTRQALKGFWSCL